MILVNNFQLDTVTKINSIKKTTPLKNVYRNQVEAKESEVRIPGRIILNCSLEYEDKKDLVKKLNSIEKSLYDGNIEIDGVVYKAKLIQDIQSNVDFNNFNIIFSYDGQVIDNGIEKDLCI